ncbi:hypothetical protein [Streptomyces sp. NPDC046261]|uniref:hypothetical protein n=1 Tax=Streptomyces sp. NPDC046261 TaxID=3157200 RepID=UPI0033FDA839
MPASLSADPSALRDALTLYSNFAAILAGFAFTAVIVIPSLPRDRQGGPDEREIEEVLTVGISSFFSLSITAVAYGSVVAASGDAYKALLGGLLSGTALALSALLLTLFIVLLLESLFSASSLATYARRMLSQFFPLIAFVNLQGPMEEYLHVTFPGHTPVLVRVVLSVFLALLVAWGAAGFFVHRWPAVGVRLSVPRSGVRWLSGATFCACTAATAAAAMYTNHDRHGSAPPVGVMMAIMTLAFLGFLCFGVCTFFLRPAPRQP